MRGQLHAGGLCVWAAGPGSRRVTANHVFRRVAWSFPGAARITGCVKAASGTQTRPHATSAAVLTTRACSVCRGRMRWSRGTGYCCVWRCVCPAGRRVRWVRDGVLRVCWLHNDGVLQCAAGVLSVSPRLLGLLHSNSGSSPFSTTQGNICFLFISPPSHSLPPRTFPSTMTCCSVSFVWDTEVVVWI